MNDPELTYYVDSSALVKAYADERGSDWMAQIIANARVVVSTLVIAEVASALARRSRERRMSLQDARLVFETFRRDLGGFDVFDASADLISSAALSMLQPDQPALRASDAVHLATALQSSILLRESGDGQLVLVVADRRLREAAAAAGLPVENPEDHA